MNRKRFFFRIGSLFLIFGCLSLAAFAVWIFVQIYTNNGFLLYSCKPSSSFILQSNALLLLYYYAEIFIGIFGCIPAIICANGFFFVGFSCIFKRASWFKIFLWIQTAFLVSLYSMQLKISLFHEISPGGLLGFRMYQLLQKYYSNEIIYAITICMLTVHIAFLMQFRGIRFISYLCNLITKNLSLIFRYLFELLCYLLKKILLSITYELKNLNFFSHYFIANTHKNNNEEFFRKTAFGNQNLTIVVESEKKEVVESKKYFKSIDCQDIFIHTAVTSQDQDHDNHIEQTAQSLEKALKKFGIFGRIVGIKQGPVVTLFEYKLEGDTKITKILALEDDLIMALEALSIRIKAPIRGTSLVGFEIANKKRQILRFGSLITSLEYQNSSHTLPLVLGHDSQGVAALYDLALMPHLLMAGSTGSGKSVTLHGFIIGLLHGCPFDLLRIIMIDPKRLELGYYQDIPQLLFPVVYEVKKAIVVLQWLIEEMGRRYENIAELRVRNINEYNSKMETDKLPFIVVVIDELADLMMTGGKDIEDKVVRLAQMARASGIHLIVATQRPSVDVVTGLIKVNFTTRVALRVTSKIDSRTIIDVPGAHKLLGKGDMLFLDGTSGEICRLHAALLTTDEIERFVSHCKTLGAPNYCTIVESFGNSNSYLCEDDLLLHAEIKKFLQSIDEVSISLLQRKFKIGYNRAARLIAVFEEQGLICQSDGSKLRKIIKS